MTGVIIILIIILVIIASNTQFPLRISEVLYDSLTIKPTIAFLGKEVVHFKEIKFILISNFKGKDTVIYLKKTDQALFKIRPTEKTFKELEIFCNQNDVALAEYEEFIGNISIINQSATRPKTAFKIN